MPAADVRWREAEHSGVESEPDQVYGQCQGIAGRQDDRAATLDGVAPIV